MNKEIKSFFENMDGFQSKIQGIEQDINESKKKIEESIALFKNEINDTKKTEMANEALSNIFRPIQDQIYESIESWDNAFINQMHAKEFRDKYIDSFLMIIYGRVKAGKSSLGNLIKKQFEDYYKCSIPIFIHSSNENDVVKENLEKNDEFAVANVECTASIQGFEHNGFAFIDTPGLFSETDENGKLSKKYISAADYVLLPMNSSSPGTQSDIEAANELIRLEKKYNIALTRSDKMINKKDKSGSYVKVNGKITKELINKSDVDRTAQENSVRSMMKERNVKISSDVSIFSLSTHMAKEAIKNNDEISHDKSNIPLLFSKMKDMISRAEELKLFTPKNNLQSFINELIEGQSINSIKNRRNSISEVLNELLELKKVLNESVADAEKEVIYKCDSFVDDYFSSKDERNIFNNIAHICNSEVNKSLMESDCFKGLTAQLELSFPSFEISGDSAFQIQPKYTEIKYTVYDVGDSSSGNHAMEGAATGAAAGATLGFPGIISGTVIGGLIGSLNKKSSTKITSHQETEQIEIGTNSEEVRGHLEEKFKSKVKEYFNKIKKVLTNETINRLEDQLHSISNSYGNLENSLQLIKKEL